MIYRFRYSFWIDVMYICIVLIKIHELKSLKENDTLEWQNNDSIKQNKIVPNETINLNLRNLVELKKKKQTRIENNEEISNENTNKTQRKYNGKESEGLQDSNNKKLITENKKKQKLFSVNMKIIKNVKYETESYGNEETSKNNTESNNNSNQSSNSEVSGLDSQYDQYNQPGYQLQQINQSINSAISQNNQPAQPQQLQPSYNPYSQNNKPVSQVIQKPQQPVYEQSQNLNNQLNSYIQPQNNDIFNQFNQIRPVTLQQEFQNYNYNSNQGGQSLGYLSTYSNPQSQSLPPQSYSPYIQNNNQMLQTTFSNQNYNQYNSKTYTTARPIQYNSQPQYFQPYQQNQNALPTMPPVPITQKPIHSYQQPQIQLSYNPYSQNQQQSQFQLSYIANSQNQYPANKFSQSKQPSKLGYEQKQLPVSCYSCQNSNPSYPSTQPSNPYDGVQPIQLYQPTQVYTTPRPYFTLSSTLTSIPVQTPQPYNPYQETTQSYSQTQPYNPYPEITQAYPQTQPYNPYPQTTQVYPQTQSYNPYQQAITTGYTQTQVNNPYQQPTTPGYLQAQPFDPYAQTASNGKQALYCYTCNENLAACAYPYDLNALKDYLTPCNGQCIKYRNPNDNYKWYRGCSWEFGFMTAQPQNVNKNGITYYFCNSLGCNAN